MKDTLPHSLAGSEDLGLKPDYRGKVRDLFDLGEQLLIVATDRISAFDHIMAEPVPGKGEMLTRISVDWFRMLEDRVAHHLISDDWRDFPEPFNRVELGGRSMLVHKTNRFDLECVVRGYLTGSGLKDYQATGEVCGIPLPKGMQDADRLSKPIFTPAFKADEGHDRNVDHAEGRDIVGDEWFDTLEETSMEIYRIGEEYARKRGIIIADTKFEFGVKDGKLLLIDEVLTPDSSRFWAVEDYQPGASPPSYDKQVLRNWLELTDWDKNSSPPALDDAIVREVYGRYRDIHERLFPGDAGKKEG